MDGHTLNRRRGDASLHLGGQRLTLRLTLGALAELESAFQVEDLAGLAARFGSGRLAARDLVAILGAAVRGGGQALSDADIAALALDDGVEGVARAIADVLEAAFGSASPNP